METMFVASTVRQRYHFSSPMATISHDVCCFPVDGFLQCTRSSTNGFTRWH